MRSFDYNTIFREELGELKAYSPEQGSYDVRLDANEAPDMLSPEVRKRLAEEFARTPLFRYPDAGQTELRKLLAKRHGVKSSQIITGVGSDEVITMLLTAATRVQQKAPVPTLLTTTPTFVMYRLSARLRGQRVMEVPLDAEWDMDLAGMNRAVEMAAPNLVFIASPNNPTGTMVSQQRLEEFVEGCPHALIVIDEAYVDYASRDQSSLLQKYENVAILRTLSKVGFAALRVGWLVGSERLVHELQKVRLPYNLPSLSQAMACAVLRDHSEQIVQITNFVRAERARVAERLNAVSGVQVAPGQEANFLWIRVSKPAAEVFSALGKRGVLVRSFHGRGGRLEQYLRVTIGVKADNDRFLDELLHCL